MLVVTERVAGHVTHEFHEGRGVLGVTVHGQNVECKHCRARGVSA